MKKLFFVTDEEGKQALSVLRAVVATLTTLLIGALFAWGQWVHTQAYTVATNKENITKTATRLERSIGINSQDIIMNHGEVEDQFDRVNGILHGRITKVDDKYDAKITELQKLLMQSNTLIVEMLIQKNKDVQLQKKEIEIQQQSRQTPKWPVSPSDGD
jgi:hypothetical protein